MNVLKQTFVCACILLKAVQMHAQADTLYYSSKQIEDIFITQNLQLIAERLNIDKADAAIIQAKLWPNPTFTLDQVNLWATESQRNGEPEIIPPLVGSFGRNTEFGIGIDQIIQLGRKRGNLIELEKVSKDIAIAYYEEILRSLKYEVRETCAEIIYNQQFLTVLENQQGRIKSLIENYREQNRKGNISQNQLIRLEGFSLEIESEMNDLKKEGYLQQKKLKTFLNISSSKVILLINETPTIESPEHLSYNNLIQSALEARPDMKDKYLQVSYASKSLKYEKSQRIPDITLHAAYDRDGNCMRNFVGFGFSIDLPFSNRNQGNIKTAQINLKQYQILVEQYKLLIHNEVENAWKNFILAYNFNQQMNPDFISSMEKNQESYTRNFVQKSIGIVELLDFFDSYSKNQQTILSAKKDLAISFEELQYTVGKELKMEDGKLN